MNAILAGLVVVMAATSVAGTVEYPTAPDRPVVERASGTASSAIRWPQIEGVRDALKEVRASRVPATQAAKQAPMRGSVDKPPVAVKPPLVVKPPVKTADPVAKSAPSAIVTTEPAVTKQEIRRSGELLATIPGMGQYGAPEIIAPADPGDEFEAEAAAADFDGVSSSAEPVVPELGGMAPVDLVAEEPLVDGEFRSKRGELGSPTAIVPAAPLAGSASNIRSSEMKRSFGSSYKMLAGALFALSLGIIGYRRFGRKVEPAEDAGFGAGWGASWLPSRKDAFRPTLDSLVPGAAVRSATSRAVSGGRMTLFTRDSVANRLVEKRVVDMSVPRGDQSAELVAHARRVLEREEETRVEDARVEDDCAGDARIEDGSRSIGFHDEIEKRVRRREILRDDRAANEDGSRLRGSRVTVDDDQYERIGEMTDRGMKVKEIAEDLSIPMATVTAIQKMRGRGSARRETLYGGVAH